jgi:hypothetical protein
MNFSKRRKNFLHSLAVIFNILSCKYMYPKFIPLIIEDHDKHIPISKLHASIDRLIEPM